MKFSAILVIGIFISVAAVVKAGGGKKAPAPKPLDRYVMEAESRTVARPDSSPGSLYDPSGRLGDLARDRRASQIDDILTIVVSDKASALSRGTTNSKREADLKAAVTAMGGPTAPAGPLAGLAGANSNTKLTSQGETTRESELTATVSARVVRVLPNGNLVVEGHKQLMVNSEWQTVTLRGVVRAIDINSSNRVSSDRLAELELFINGKGVVNDAIRRPNIVYRILMGILPF